MAEDSVNLAELLAQLKDESSEGRVGFYPLPEGFMVYALSHCEKCGKACSLSTPSWPIQNGNLPRLRAWLWRLGAEDTAEPDQIGWNEKFGGAVCYACDSDIGTDDED